ncbi:MAG: CDP-archaeol synthase [Desulfurivibrionaceae bacterium]|jgi:predicted MPP superfamily phosphohydrolase|nr:CDP-archaeol synthase [Pseudomonadota bacterium]MCG2824241.1 CDP-archaeol synthase [Desulfobulbaceae bacterium]MDP2003177.1 CDP-archaeol synthase [Desulfurivibrionaceae bacterium]PKN23699.1 MAG: CDP-archaeol synthase [Deltaproteobacteria bacterium HGW-Deltaproteobacteria-3]MBU4230218.1 CDP-archaeol synthase [Pseudomonadota bacterium]
MTAALKILCFLFWGNLLPPLASLALGDRLAKPLDHGTTWFDGRPLFGPHKTIRGILTSLIGSTLAFPLLGVSWQTAMAAGALLMAGDLLSSFIKRRLHMASGESVFGLDQIFEGLLPALYLASRMQAPLWSPLLALVIFVPVAHAGARFWKYVLFKPPTENYPRFVRSTVRLREWRSCHQPLARWHVLFNLSSLIYNRVVVSTVFRLLGLYRQGLANALQLELTEHEIPCPRLPQPFDGFTILLLTDLHLDGLPGLVDQALATIGERSFDLCLIGGDIRMETYGPIAPSLRELRRLLPHITTKHGTFGVLGNHDCIEMVPDFEEAGMLMLVNDATLIEKNGENLWLVGIDDPNYYKTHDPAKAFSAVPPNAISILLAHSPEAYQEAVRHQAALYLCGHTHGGQICLCSGTPIYTNSSAPRFTASGRWQYQGMQGFTSRGVGASGAPLRFNCPGEIAVLTLRTAAMQPATDTF